MRFSMKTEYGVRAVVELAGSPGGAALQSAEIARRQRIPGPFLDQVLMTLRRAGLVRSVRGPRGGHLLNRPAADIRLDELVGCLEGEPSSADGAARQGESILSAVSQEADRAVHRVLAAHTVSDLLRAQRSQAPIFHGIYRAITPRAPVGEGPAG